METLVYRKEYHNRFEAEEISTMLFQCRECLAVLSEPIDHPHNDIVCIVLLNFKPKVKPWLEKRISNGQCSRCPNPVAKKSNGQAAKLCQRHLDLIKGWKVKHYEKQDKLNRRTAARIAFQKQRNG